MTGSKNLKTKIILDTIMNHVLFSCLTYLTFDKTFFFVFKALI